MSRTLFEFSTSGRNLFYLTKTIAAAGDLRTIRPQHHVQDSFLIAFTTTDAQRGNKREKSIQNERERETSAFKMDNLTSLEIRTRRGMISRTEAKSDLKVISITKMYDCWVSAQKEHVRPLAEVQCSFITDVFEGRVMNNVLKTKIYIFHCYSFRK